MLEGITIALKTHYDTAIEAQEILEDAIAKIGEKYISAKYAEMTGEAKDIYNKALDESRQKNYDTCIQILDQIKEQAEQVVSVPVPTEFVSRLEALKLIKEPTEKEIESLVETYKNNYFAYRSICDFLNVLEKPVTIDEIKEYIVYIKTNLYICFYSDNVQWYHYRNWMEGTLIPNYDQLFTAFLEGRFEEAFLKDEQNETE